MTDVWDRFWSKVEEPFDAHNDCWIWKGAGYASKLGYGRFQLSNPRRLVGAHRFAYEQFYGPISAGLVLDHMCRNPRCVNPTHLRVVTRSQNTLENSVGVTAVHAVKKDCVRGHPLSGENLYLRPNGGRACRMCRRLADIKRRKLKRLYLIEYKRKWRREKKQRDSG
jgi:hypothetical protein